MDKMLHRWGRNRRSIPVGLEGVYLQSNSLMEAEHQNQQEQPVIHISQCNRTSESRLSGLTQDSETDLGQQPGVFTFNRQSGHHPIGSDKQKDKEVKQGNGLWKKLEETAEQTKRLFLGDKKQRSRSKSAHSRNGSNRKSPCQGKSPMRTGTWRKQHRNRSKNHLTVF